jgi:hypothetical protein
MDGKMVGLAFSIAVLAASAAAQTVTGSGTTNTVPVFTGASTVGNSPIAVSGGNVGIGTTSPLTALEVDGQLDVGTHGYWMNDADTIQATSIPGSPAIVGAYQPGMALTEFGSKANDSNAYFTNDYFGAGFGQASNSITLENNGNVGIGTTAPTYPLDVSGQIRTTGGIVFPDGSIQSVAYAGCTGGDYAESMNLTGDPQSYTPGDILVLDADNPGKILKSSEPYATTIAGIYSTKPGFVGRRQTTPKSDSEVPMAMVGVVPTKVSAENGSIKVGDLLVSSTLPGYAMKGTDRSRMLGAVIGKAMASLDSGTGTIEVLVSLQ